MISTIFLQSAVQDPHELYEGMRVNNPVYWDDINNTWAIYSYEYCKLILSSPFVHIPSLVQNDAGGLNEFALSISHKMARVSNGIDHEIARQVVMFLLSKIKAVDVRDIIKKLIKNENTNRETDWVNTICKRLPVMAIAKSLGFADDDCGFISGNIEGLIKIMTPFKTPAQITTLNTIAKEIYEITEKHLQKINFYKLSYECLEGKYNTTTAEIVTSCTSNLIGLFIQSYDAGRGILSNSLLQMITNINLTPCSFTNELYVEKCIIETLRFDPPVHNTRRIAIADIAINNILIKNGDSILLVLAAANRDPQRFDSPGVYNIERLNNIEHLTFGIGGHRCPAKSFVVALTVDALSFVFGKYNAVTLIEKDIHYEPLANVRLPKNLFISLS